MENNQRIDQNVFCLAPWVSIYVSPVGGIQACCESTEVLGFTSGSLIKDWNTDKMKILRKEFLNNEKPAGCRACYDNEKLGHRSLRKKMLHHFSNENDFVLTTQKDGSVQNLNIKYVDIRWSNLCNFRCRFCGVGLSSSWFSDKLKRYGDVSLSYNGGLLEKDITESGAVSRPNINYQEFLSDVLPSVEAIQFLGGEPFLMDEFYETLAHLRTLKKWDVHISIVTNLSKMHKNNRHFFDMIEGFKNVSCSISLDGVYEQAEYLRKGTYWADIERNLNLVVESQSRGSIKYSILHTVYILNAFHSPVALRWFREKFPSLEVKLNMLHSPEFFSLKVLPTEIKKELSRIYMESDNLFYKPLLEQLLESCCDAHFITDLLFEIKKMDQIREESFLKTFHEYSKYLLFQGLN